MTVQPARRESARAREFGYGTAETSSAVYLLQSRVRLDATRRIHPSATRRRSGCLPSSPPPPPPFLSCFPSSPAVSLPACLLPCTLRRVARYEIRDLIGGYARHPTGRPVDAHFRDATLNAPSCSCDSVMKTRAIATRREREISLFLGAVIEFVVYATRFTGNDS